MALIKCKECGGDVSTEAKACPSCGAAVAQPPGRLKVFLLGSIVLAAAYGIFHRTDAPSESKTPAVSAEQARANALEDARFTMVVEAVKAVKSALRDPDSLKWEFIGVDDAGTVACMKYRARNGFGGMNAEFVVIANNKATKTVADWKKHCNRPLHDLTAAG